MYTHRHTHTDTHTQTYTCTHTRACMYTHRHAHTETYTHTYMHVHTEAHMHARAHTHTHTHTHSDPLYSTADMPVKSRGAAGLEWVPGLRGPAGQRSAVSLGHHMALGLLRLSWEIERIWELGLPCLYPDHSTCSMEL